MKTQSLPLEEAKASCESFIYAGFTPEGGHVFDCGGPSEDLLCLLEELDIWLDGVRAS